MREEEKIFSIKEEKIYSKIYKYLEEMGYEGKIDGEYKWERRNKGFNITFLNSGLCFKFDRRKNIFESNAVVYNGILYNKETYVENTLKPFINDFIEYIKDKFNTISDKYKEEKFSFNHYEIKYRIDTQHISFSIKTDIEHFKDANFFIYIDDLLRKVYYIDNLDFEISKSSFNSLDAFERKIISYVLKPEDAVRIDFEEDTVEYDSEYVKELFLNGFDIDKIARERFRDFISYYYKRKNTKILDIDFEKEKIKIGVRGSTNYKGKKLNYNIEKTIKYFLAEEKYAKVEKEIQNSLEKKKDLAIKNHEQYLEDKRKEAEEKIEKAKSIYDSEYFKNKQLLCYCVLNFLYEHEYMSKTSLRAFLNGKKMNSFYHVTIGYGAFNGINEIEVLETLEEYGIVYSSEKYNSYGNYIVSYYIEKGIKNYLSEILDIKTNDKNNILYNIKNNENFKDISFIQQLVENKTTLNVFQDILKFNYKDFDDTIKIYLETMSGLETDKDKKTILNHITK